MPTARSALHVPAKTIEWQHKSGESPNLMIRSNWLVIFAVNVGALHNTFESVIVFDYRRLPIAETL